MKTNRRAVWLWVIFGVTAVGVTVRLGIAIVGAVRVDGEGEFSGVAALLAPLLLTAGFIVALFPVMQRRHRHQLSAVRQLRPDELVFQANLVPSTVDAFSHATPSVKVKVNTAVAVVFGLYEVSLWRGPRQPRRVGGIVSDEPITYRVGTLEHYGRRYEALLATVRTGSTEHTIPFAVVSDPPHGFMSKMAAGDELESIVASLDAQRSIEEDRV